MMCCQRRGSLPAAMPAILEALMAFVDEHERGGTMFVPVLGQARYPADSTAELYDARRGRRPGRRCLR